MSSLPASRIFVSQTIQATGWVELMRSGDTVRKAVDASRPETATQIGDSRQAVRDVSESQNEYCDSSAEANIALGIDPSYLRY